MSSNNILNSQESTTILNARRKKIWKLIECTIYIYIYMCVCVCFFFFFVLLRSAEHSIFKQIDRIIFKKNILLNIRCLNVLDRY